MAIMTPAPRIGKTTGAARGARLVRKPRKTAAKPASIQRSMMVQPLRQGLINR